MKTLDAKKIVLDKSKYGKGLGILWKMGWGWVFWEEKADKEDKSPLLTVCGSLFPKLVAVTDKQYKEWKKKKIFYHFRWSKKSCNGL